MKPNKQKLSTEEKAILKAFESGKLRSIPNVVAEKKRLQKIANAHGIKKVSGVHKIHKKFRGSSSHKKYA